MIFQQLKNRKHDIVNVAETRSRIAFGVMKSSGPTKDVSKPSNQDEYLIAISESPWFNFCAAPIDPLIGSESIQHKRPYPAEIAQNSYMPGHTGQSSPQLSMH